MTNQNNAAQAAQQHPIDEAIVILTEEADSLSECHTRTPGDWAGEPEAKARYDHILAIVGALSKLRAPVADVSNIAGQLWDDAIACDWSSFRERVVSALASAPVAGEAQERIEQMAVNRYRPVPDGKFSYKVVAGDGSRSLYTGTKDSCLRVAAKLTEAFLDGAFVASDASPQSSKDGEHGE